MPAKIGIGFQLNCSLWFTSSPSLELFKEAVNWFSYACLLRSFGEYLNLIVKVIKKTLGSGRYIHLNTALSCC